MAKSENQVISVKSGGGKLRKVLVVLLVLVLALAGLWMWRNHQIDERGKAYLEEALKRARELRRARPAPKPDDNAAAPFLAACKLHVKPSDPAVTKTRGDAARDYRSPAVAKYVADNAKCLAGLEAALKLPGCDYGDTYTGGLVGQNLPSTLEIRKAVRLLAVSARHAAATGKTGIALARLEQLLRTADPVCDQPALLTRMLRCSTEEAFARALAGVLSDSRPAEAELKVLRKKLVDHLSRRGDLTECMETDHVLLSVTVGQAICQEIPLQGVLTGGCQTWWWRFSGNCFKDMEMVDAAQRGIIKDLSQPYPQALDAIGKKASGPFEPPPKWAIVCNMAMPSIERTAEGDCEALAGLRMAQVLVDLRLHRLVKGGYPAKLAEVEGAPLDPFTGKALGYKRTEKGCLVWSAGKNRKDDGGTTAKNRHGDGPLDVVLELEE
jgi:hypothetical protein